MAKRNPTRPALCAGLATIMICPPPAFAGDSDLPTGGQVTAGTAAIASSGGHMLINQSSARAVIDWTSFDIGQQSGVTFDMPGTSAAVLNRVTGATPSTIAGSLSANGQVFLVNPNGIAITGSGAVKVGGGFTASTLDLRVDDFLQGRFIFSGTSPAGITHEGRIEAGEGGFAALIAQGAIDNRGLISVPAGRVALGTGSAITLDPTGTGFMQILAPALGEDSGRIQSSGRIAAEGGRIEIKAASAAQAVRDIVKISGEVSVASVRKQGGTIILDGGSSGLRVSGKLSASSREAKGGRVAVGGKRIALEAVSIDVKGASGGVVTVGGGRQGAPIPGLATAAAVSIDDSSIIDASALTESGGDIVVWSGEDTRFLGTIRATGAGGDGGAAEVSSLGAYAFAGHVNLLSADGSAGQLLLDPYDVTISAGADANQTGFTATGSGATINATSLQDALAAASVTVLTGSSGSETGTITLDAPLSWSANTTLTLDAAGGILLNADLTTSGTGSGLTLTAAGSGGVSGAGNIASNGTLTFNVNDAAASGVFAGMLSGTGQVIKGGAGSLTLAGANSYTGATSINTGTVRAGSSSALGNTSGLTLASTFDMAGYNADIGSLGGGGTITNSGSAATLTLGRNNVSRAFSGTIDEGTATISLVKAGNGPVTLDGPLRYTGSTTINGGLLQIRGGSLNSGTYSGNITIAGSGTLRFSSGVDHTLSGTVSGPGALLKDSSPSVLTLSNANGLTGSITISAGTLRAGSANGFGTAALTANAGTTLDLAGFSTNVGSLAGAGTVTNTGAAAILTTGSNNASTTFSGVLQNGTGALGLTKTGTGTLTLTGTNTFTGGTSISAGGILQLGDGGTSGSVAGTISNSGTLVFNRSDSFTYTGSLNGAVTKLGSGTLTYTGTTGSANITINQGAFQFGDGGSICCITPSFVNNASLVFNHSVLYGYNGTISGTGSVTKLGTGTLDFTGANSYTGSTTVSAGSLRIRSAASATGLATSSGITVNGTLDLSGFSPSIASLAGTGTITNNGAAATLTAGSNNSSTTFSGTIQNGTGVLSLTKVGTGTLSLTNNNGYTGQTTISTGTLTLAGSGTLVSDIAVASGATLSFSRTPFTYAGVISGTGSLNFSGGMTFSGNNTFTGTGAVCTGCTITVGTGGTSGTLGGTLHFYAGTSLIFNRSDTSTFAGSITGNAHIIKDGVGTLIVTGSFNTGTATINAGILQIGAGGTAGTISNNITNNSAIVFNRSNALTYAGVISGTGSLTQAGSGTLTFTGNNTYTGGTYITAGTLQLGNGGTTGMITGGVVNNGTLAFNRSDAVTFGDIVSGTGELTQMGSGTLILTVNNSYAGVTTINATRSLQIGDGGTTGSIAGNVTNNGALIFNRSSALTYGGVISGTGTLRQSGTGTLTLSMPNTATGVTTVDPGSTLQFGIGGFAGSVGGSIVNNGLVILNHSIDYIYGTQISGSGSLTKIGPNNLTFGDLAYTGVTTISAGTLQLGNGGTTGSVAGNIVNNTALVFKRSDALTYAGVISGTGSLTQAGSGTLTLSGTNSYTGATSITAGTLKAGSATALGSNSALTVAAGAVFDIAGSSTSAGSLAGAGTVTNSGNAATLTLGGDNTSTTFSGVMQNGTGTLALVKAGTGAFTVTGANTYTGGSTISGGTMQIGDGGTTGDIGGAIVNNGQLIIYRSNRWTQGGSISGTGSVLVRPGGAILSRDNSYTGLTTVESGATVNLGWGGATGTLAGPLLNNGYIIVWRNPLTLDSTISGNGTFEIRAFLTLTANSSFSGTTQIVSGSVTIGNGGTSGSWGGTVNGSLGVNRADLSTFNGSLTGSLILNGTGTVVLTGSAAGATINAGTLQIGDGGTTGSVSGSITNTGALVFNRSNALTQSGIVSGSGSLTQAGAGTLILSAANTYSGATNVTSGTLKAGSASAFGSNSAVSLSAGTTLDLAGQSLSIGSLSGTSATLTNSSDAATLTVGGDNSTTSISGLISDSIGPISLVKIGTGSFGLSVSNLYRGATTVNAGTLRIFVGGSTPLDYGGSLSIASGATLRWSALAPYRLSGPISGAGAIQKDSFASILTFADASAFSGSISVGVGILQAGSSSAFGAGSTMTLGSTLDLAGYSVSLGSLSGAGTVTNSGATAATLTVGALNSSTTFSGIMQNGAGTLALVKAGTGTFTVTGANTHTGGTTVNAGGALQMGNGGTTGTINGAITNNGSVILNTSANGWFNGFTMSGGGSFTKTGSGNILTSINHTNTGGIIVTNGVLWYGAVPQGDITVHSPGKFYFNNNGSFTYSGVMSGSGQVLKYGPGTITLTGDSTALGSFLMVNGSLQIGNGGTSGNLGATLTNNAGTTVVINRSDDFTYAGVLSGSVNKTGAGKMTLARSGSSFSMTVSQGTLQIGDGGSASGISGSIVNNAAVVFDHSNAFSYASSISGTGSLTKSGSGTLTLSGTNSYSGDTLISAGTVKAGSATGLSGNSALTLSAATTLDLGGFSSTLGSLAGAGTVTNSGAAATLTAGGNNASTTFSGVLQNGTGTLALTKTGTGTLTLSSVNTLTGGTTIAAGALQLGNGATGAVYGNIVNNGTLIRNSAGSWSPGTITGTGSIQLLGGQTVFDRDQTYTGLTTIASGATLNVGIGAATGSLAGDIVNDGSLLFNRSNLMSYSGALSGTGSLTKAGAGTLILSGANAFTGATAVTAGTLKAGSATAFGSNSAVTVSPGANLDLGGFSTSIGSLSGGGTVTNSGVAASLSTGGANTSTTFSGVIQNGAGSTAIVKAGTGTFTLSGANTYTGSTTVAAGTLMAGSVTGLGSTSSLVVSNGASLDLGGFSTSIGSLAGDGTVINSGAAATLTTGANHSSTSFSGALRDGAGALALVKLGTGTLTLAGDNSQTGPMTINGGRLELSGSWNAGSTAALEVATGASMSGSGTLTAGMLTVGGEGTIALTGANMIGTLASGAPVGALLLTNAQSLTLASVQARGALNVAVSGTSSDLTIAAGAIVRSDAAGDAVRLSSAGRFTNASGAGAVSAPNGRWLIYLPSPSGSSFNGLDSGNTAIWNTSAGAAVAQPGSRYVFAVRPTLTVSSNNMAKTYGEDATAQLATSYMIAGFDPGLMGAYLGDSLETALSGTPIVTSAGTSANGLAGTYQIDVAEGSLTSLTGYDLAFSSSGLLTVERAGLTVRARDAVKTYDGLAFGGGNGVTYEGFVNGEAADVLSGALSYGGTAQGAVNAGRYGLSVSGLTSGNYDISYLDGILVIEAVARPEAQIWAGPVPMLRTDPGWMGLLSQKACCLVAPRMRYAQEWLPETDIIAPWLIEPIEEIAERY